jgi:hypothetical protein
MDVQTVLLDFTRGITVGTAVVLGIIVLASLSIPRRVIANTPPRRLVGKSR